jgi:hypothetical protein
MTAGTIRAEFPCPVASQQTFGDQTARRVAGTQKEHVKFSACLAHSLTQFNVPANVKRLLLQRYDNRLTDNSAHIDNIGQLIDPGHHLAQ